jgi:DNA-binding transcriptional regulator YhcF (GntR family)
MDSYIEIKNSSETPKYQQIISCVIDALNQKIIKKGDKIPSLNQLTKEFNLSQDTVLNAYNELKARGIISSAVGKGYYVARNSLPLRYKIFVLFDKLTAYKEILYDSFKASIGNNGELDIYFHHSNTHVFTQLIDNAIGHYNAYVIMPLDQKPALKYLDNIPDKQLYLLDRGGNFTLKQYAGVFQDFQFDTFNALSQGYELLKKYSGLKIICNDNRDHLRNIIYGCEKFCHEKKLSFEHLHQFEDQEIRKGNVYLVINDNDLVSLVLKINKKKLQIGKDIGLISYNDTPLKQITAGGITTISTDFERMGKTLGDLILQGEKKAISNPSKLIIRNSL